jgi:hypothetical protein
MRTQEIYTAYHDHFEYFGNTEIVYIRMQEEEVIKHDWINLDNGRVPERSKGFARVSRN